MQKTGLNKTINYCIWTLLRHVFSKEQNPSLQVHSEPSHEFAWEPVPNSATGSQWRWWPVKCAFSPTLHHHCEFSHIKHKQVELLPPEDAVRSSPYLLFHCTWPRGLCHWVHSAWHTWLGGDGLADTWLPTHYWPGPGKTDLKICSHFWAYY